MIIKDDILSLYQQIKYPDPHDQIDFNELVYGLEVKDRIYAFCPFCQDILEVSSDQIESRKGGRIRLKDTVSCSCRKGLRYIAKGTFLTPRFQRNTRFQLISTGVCAAVAAASGLGFYGGIVYNEQVGIFNDLLAYFLLSLPFVGGAAFICMLICLIFPMEKHFRYGEYELPPYDPYKEIRQKIEALGREYERRLAREKAAARPKQWEDGIFGFGGIAGISQGLHDDGDDGPDNSFQNAYIPDDFEPDMDPYDREALYDDAMIDGYIIAGGGNPYDFDTRMDALSDPFDSGGDGWGD